MSNYDKIAAMHAKCECRVCMEYGDGTHPMCMECKKPWPCPTWELAEDDSAPIAARPQRSGLPPKVEVDPDMQRILEALGIPDAESLHDILERIRELTPEAEPPVTVEMINAAFEEVSGVPETSRGQATLATQPVDRTLGLRPETPPFPQPTARQPRRGHEPSCDSWFGDYNCTCQ
jgi:hypothetical protein